MNDKIELSTQRVSLVPIQNEHAEEIFSYRCDKIVNRYQGWIPDSVEDVYRFIEKVSENININGTWFQFVIIEKYSGKLLGDVGVHFIDNDDKQVEIGCTLSAKFHGKGFAIEALSEVINFLFNELKKHRITASIDPENNASIKLFEKLGFRKEAHFKESIFMNGEWVDDVVYAMLNREWKINTIE